jgi:outer membrane lipoprotein-sorting protein
MTPSRCFFRRFPRRLAVRLLPALLAAALVLASAVAPGVAAPPPAATLSAQDRADMQRIEQYLNGIHTMTARFQQFSDSGGTASGTLSVARPGRMRFEYDKPIPILLIADGTFVVYIDYSLKETTYLPIGSTPAWFLLREHISLTDGITVTRFEHGPGVLRLSVVENKSPENGTLTLVFSDRPLELKQWTIVDQQGKTTTVSLTDLQSGMTLDPQLFTFVDPKKKGDQK